MITHFIATEYVADKTKDGYGIYRPIRNTRFSTKKKAEEYFDGYKYQKFITISAHAENSVGQEMSEEILSNF